MKIADFDLDESVLVVAEIGNNHEGDPDVALELVRSAAAAGAGAVKFQTFTPEHYVRRSDRERFEMLSRFRLPPEDYERLAAAARDEGLLFLSTAFDLPSVGALEQLVDAYKIASGDITFIPLLEAIGRTGKPILLSTGASRLDEVDGALKALDRPDGVCLLHCTSSYPAPDEDANVAAVATLKERFGRPVGFSDHTLGNEAASLAVALGARVIEKHFTLDRNYSDFRDHAMSADPQQFRDLVDQIRATTIRLGDGDKDVRPSESETRSTIRRSVAAARDLPQGRVLAERDLTWVRPGSGIAPGEESRVVGRRLLTDLAQGDHITPEVLGGDDE